MEYVLFPVLVVMCISAHIVRTVYEFVKHKKLLEPSKLSFVIILIDMVILWMSWFLLNSLDPHRIEIPVIIRYSGVILIFAGMVLFLTGLFTIKTLESYKGNLITKGIYSKIRHPMYTGFILWLIGPPLLYGSLYSFVLSIVFIANVLYWRQLEEYELEKRFPEYLNYKKKTLF
jgi:protein-S-isoprenylcysteine O-methyltransferase Ste14